MPSFLENLRPFYGTNEKNAAGESLEEFLEHYDPYKYRTPSCTTDAVIFLAPEHLTKELKGMRVLLVKRSNHPSIGFWALPGGFYRDAGKSGRYGETGTSGGDQCKRSCDGAELVHTEIMIGITRTRVITTAYMAVLQGEGTAGCAPAMMRRTLCGAIPGIGGNICADRRRTNGRRCEWNKAGRRGICYRVYPPCDEPGTWAGHERFGRIPAKRNAGAEKNLFR